MKTRQAGFTIVELVVVIVLMGILSAVIVPKLVSDSTFAAAAWRSDIVSALRYAQKTAVSHRRMVCASVDASAVTLTISANNVAGPGSNSTCSAAPLCGALTLPAPDSSTYVSKDPAVTASGSQVGVMMLFQPNGTITTTCSGTTYVSTTITILPASATANTVQITGATGYVE
ncbi:MAG: prepilin-type N-terminal cleavage/methylation domain-containing protein [Pseudomonadota bacterium]